MTEEILKKFKLTWEERQTEHDGCGDEIDHYFVNKELIIEAKSEDAACEIWENEHANEGTNGLDDI